MTARINLLLLTLLMTATVLGQTTVTNGIASVAPASAPQGTNGLLVTFNLISGLTPPVPAATVTPSSVVIGTNIAISPAHPSQYVVTAVFNISLSEAVGLKDVAVTFPRPTGGPLTYNRLQAFQVTSSGSSPLFAGFSASPANGAVPLAVNFTDASTGTITNRLWDFGDGATSTNTNPSHTYTNAGGYTVSLTVLGPGGSNPLTRANAIVVTAASATAWRFAVVSDTHVTNNPTILPEIVSSVIQDNARLLLTAGDIVNTGTNTPAATLQRMLTNWWNATAPARGAGITVLPLRGNHENDADDSVTAWNNFFSGSRALPANGPAGETNLTYSVAYSNALFIGLDDYVNIHRVNQAWLDPQLTNNTRPHVFVFGHEPAFKVFHADCLGSVPDARNDFWQSLSNAGARVYFCGHDHFFDFARIDDGDGNTANDLYQCIVDYTRSPDTTHSAAIHPLFNCTPIIDESGGTNWPFYWAGTTHEDANHGGTFAVYVCFGEALGWMTNQSGGYVLMDVHGAGTQRSDPKTGSAADYPHGHGPQGDVVRITNFVRLVRTTTLNEDTVGDGLPDWWRRQYFGSGTTTNASSCANCDPDHDGLANWEECLAGTNPTNAASVLRLTGRRSSTTEIELGWESVPGKTYGIQFTSNLAGDWLDVPGTTTNASTAAITLRLPLYEESAGFYRLRLIAP